MAEMILWVLLALGIVAAFGLGFCIYMVADYDCSGWWFFGMIAMLFATMGLLITSTVPLASRAVGRGTCARWATYSGYQTKFVILNWADGGTCLARTKSGHWVPNTQIIINNPERP